LGLNFFLFGPPHLPGEFGPTGVGDLFAIIPPSGVDRHLTFICRGAFDGVISIEGSGDGVNFDILTQFEATSGSGGQLPVPLEFSPKVVDADVRFVRANIRAKILLPTQLSLGAEQNCACSPPT
jgi:hypothetical protein